MTFATHRVTTALRALFAVVSLPPTLAHEATHAILAAPWADRVGVVVETRDVGAHAAIEWRDEVPTLAVTVARYGPLVVGFAIAAGGLAYMGVTRTVPKSAWGWWWFATLGYWWYMYVTPSASDRNHGDHK